MDTGTKTYIDKLVAIAVKDIKEFLDKCDDLAPLKNRHGARFRIVDPRNGSFNIVHESTYCAVLVTVMLDAPKPNQAIARYELPESEPIDGVDSDTAQAALADLKRILEIGRAYCACADAVFGDEYVSDYDANHRLEILTTALTQAYING